MNNFIATALEAVGFTSGEKIGKVKTQVKRKRAVKKTSNKKAKKH